MNKIEEKEGRFKSWDNTELFYRAWNTRQQTDKAIVYLHRGHEHSGRLSEMVNVFGAGFKGFAYDSRGHGNSPGPRGYAEDFAVLVKDLDCFVRFISQEYDMAVENIAIVANSVGAVVASAWVHDYAPPIRCEVLVAPAFRIKLYVPFAVPLLRLLMCIKPVSFIKSYVKSKLLTHDAAQAAMYDEDKLITRDIAVNILLGLHDTATRIVDDAAGILTPTLVLSAGRDWIVKKGPQKKFFDNLSSKVKEYIEFPGFFHAILYEQQREKAFDKAKEFIQRCFDEKPQRAFLLNSDKEGFFKREYDRLNAGPGLFKSIFYGIQKFSMKTGGLLSEGIRLGFSNGFDSGKTLDYIYANKPQGRTIIGRLIDQIYLNAIGWVGIRQRKIHLEQTLHEAIDRLSSQGKNIRILDIASGPGRYILNVVKQCEDKDISVLLRDYKQENIDAARQLAEQMQVKNVSVQLGDAFDRQQLAAISPIPNIGVVSGLYELFSDNEMVSSSLRGIGECMGPGGCLIYTGQPWHPQIEMIAWTLPNREGKPWIMRRRCQAELDELVKAAGFKKIDMKIDKYGIFTVSIAIKEQNV